MRGKWFGNKKARGKRGLSVLLPAGQAAAVSCFSGSATWLSTLNW